MANKKDELRKEVIERGSWDEYGDVTVTRTTRIYEGATLLSELPAEQRVIQIEDDAAKEPKKLRDIVALAREGATPKPQVRSRVNERLAKQKLTAEEKHNAKLAKGPAVAVLGKEIIPLAVLEAKEAAGEEMHPAEKVALAEARLKKPKK
jgi:hypothetical protein